MIKGQAGFTLTEVVVAVAITVIIAAGAIGLESSILRMRSHTETMDWVYKAKAETTRTINNATAWNNTLNASENAATFNCILNRTSCTGAGGLVHLKNQENADAMWLRAPASPATSGLTKTGEPCNSYGADFACPYQYQIRWAPICANAGCTRFQIQLSGEFGVSSMATEAVAINPANFNFTVLRGESVPNVSDTCTSVGGTYDSTTQTCNVPLSSSCPAALDLVIGFTASGDMMCGSFNAFRCPPGQVLIGLSPDGTVVCDNGCDGTSGSSTGSFGDTL